MHGVCSDEKTQPPCGRQVFEAQSKHPASKKTDFPVKHEFVSWEYTHHNNGSSLHGQGVEVLPSGAVRIHQVLPPQPFDVLNELRSQAALKWNVHRHFNEDEPDFCSSYVRT